MTILLAIIAGLGLGVILERGDFCFHSALRGVVRRPRRLDLIRAYFLMLLISVPLVQLMRWAGWIDPWIAPLVWRANVIGGLIFGVGMVVASTCITGLFYKLGHGMLGTLAALVTWAIGDIVVYRGPLSGLRETLNSDPLMVDGQSPTLANIFGPTVGALLLVALAVAMAFFLWRSPRNERKPYWSWPLLGVATALFTTVAWLLAQAGGSNYTYGTSHVPTTLFEMAVTGTSPSWWIPVSLLSIIPGAFLAALFTRTLWVRGETAKRYLELAGGGFLMGVGAAISGGCNLGHSLVGVSLLSMGSITTTISMAVGVWLAHWVTTLSRPTESPSSAKYETGTVI